MKPVSRELLKTLFLIAFLAGGLLLVRAGALPVLAWCGLTVLVIVLRLMPRLDNYREEMTITDEAISRQHGSRLRRTSVETVRWDALRRVEVRAHETGPARDEMLFLLFGQGQEGVAVPAPLAREHDLPALLARRLPGFRQDLLAEAMARSDRASFVLWPEAAAGEDTPETGTRQ